MANFNANLFYRRQFMLNEDVFNLQNKNISYELRYNMILEAIKRYKQNTNDTLRFTVDYNYIIMYKGESDLRFTRSCEYRPPLKLSEKKNPEWSEFIRILNATFYEKKGIYSAYLAKMTELCEDNENNVCGGCMKSYDVNNPNELGFCNCWCDRCNKPFRGCKCYKVRSKMCANLMVKKVPLAFTYDNEGIEYVSTTKMMIKGQQSGLNDKPRIFRNIDAIVMCEFGNHNLQYYSAEYLEYTERVLDGLIEFREDLIALNQILLNEINEVESPLIENAEITECPVCYENTNKRTRTCNHSLCDNCFNRLPGQKKCPLCRNVL